MLGLSLGQKVGGSPVEPLSIISVPSASKQQPDPGGSPAKRAASPTHSPRNSLPLDGLNSRNTITGKPHKGNAAAGKSNPNLRALSTLLSSSGSPQTALLRDCNQLSLVINGALEKFGHLHPAKSVHIKRALADSVSAVVCKDNLKESARSKSTAAPASHTPATYAQAVSLYNGTDQNKKRVLRVTPPRNHGSNDRRVMIRLRIGHPARQLDDYAIREKIRSVVPDPTLVQDLWKANSGITVLAPTPAKGASLIQHSKPISVALDATRVGIQQDWTTFVVGLISKQLQTDTVIHIDINHIRAEIASFVDTTHICHLKWTNKSLQSLTKGYVRVLVPSTKAPSFPTHLRLFGRPALVNRIKRKISIPVCVRCYGYHNTRTCARPLRCLGCGALCHDGACTTPTRCLNCLRPHPATDLNCFARPKLEHGIIRRLTHTQKRAVRSAGSRAYAKAHGSHRTGGEHDPEKEDSGGADNELESAMEE